MGKEITSKVIGDEFERVFLQRARLNGLWAQKNDLSATYTYSNKLKVLKSELDYKLISPYGDVGFFDCKSYNSNKFSYSRLDSEQIRKSFIYNEWMVPSGFVVWFRPINRVAFFSGYDIEHRGPKTSFGVADGFDMGRVEEFDLRDIMKKIKFQFQFSA